MIRTSLGLRRFIKTSEVSQEEYCIEDNNLALKASDLIGKKVKVYYDERVGLFSTGACSEAPIIKIKEVENEKEIMYEEELNDR